MSLADSNLRARQLFGPEPLVSPGDPYGFQPASIEVHLAPELRVPKPVGRYFRVDPRTTQPEECFESYVMPESGYWLEPGAIALGATLEWISVPPDLEVILDGVSSNGRWWLTIHQTSGYGDPGFHGVYVLELKNQLPWAFLLYPGMRIGQLRYTRMDGTVDRKYGEAGNRYQGQSEATGSRAWQGNLQEVTPEAEVV